MSEIVTSKEEIDSKKDPYKGKEVWAVSYYNPARGSYTKFFVGTHDEVNAKAKTAFPSQAGSPPLWRIEKIERMCALDG